MKSGPKMLKDRYFGITNIKQIKSKLLFLVNLLSLDIWGKKQNKKFSITGKSKPENLLVKLYIKQRKKVCLKCQILSS